MAITLLAVVFASGCRPTPPPPPADIADLAIPLEYFSKPEIQPLTPEPSAKLDRRLVPECSGLVASRKFPGIFWTHSDSDAPATLVPIRADGTVVKPSGAGADYIGVKIAGVKNIDWEAVTIDGRGRIIIADIGNNNSDRKDLRLLVFPEPDPSRDTVATPQIIPVRYRDQTDFSKKNRKIYDSESIFTWRGSVYVFTKRWSDFWTVLYRLQMDADNRTGVFVPVSAFDVQGLVTDAEVSPDGRQLAVLTYHNVWLFTLPTAANNKNGGSPSPISGTAHYYPVQFPLDKWQVEGISFIDNKHVLIGSEQGVLFILDLSEIPEAKRKRGNGSF